VIGIDLSKEWVERVSVTLILQSVGLRSAKLQLRFHSLIWYIQLFMDCKVMKGVPKRIYTKQQQNTAAQMLCVQE